MIHVVSYIIVKHVDPINIFFLSDHIKSEKKQDVGNGEKRLALNGSTISNMQGKDKLQGMGQNPDFNSNLGFSRIIYCHRETIEMSNWNLSCLWRNTTDHMNMFSLFIFQK